MDSAEREKLVVKTSVIGVYVKAYATEKGKKKYVKNSPTAHTYTGNGTKKYTNAKAVTVKKSKVTLKKGKSFKTKAKVKGACYVYVYAHNGVSKQVKVTVK